MAKPYAIGIDLGTAYSCVGVFQHGKVKIIANDQGNRTTPSYVAFTDSELLIGDAAKNQVAMNPSNTVFDVTRLIGRKFSDTPVQSGMKHWPFKVIQAEDGKPKIEVNYKGEKKTFTPEEILSMILMKMKETAEAFLGLTVKDAVVAVPNRFDDIQRQAIKDAGAIAGLNLCIINETTVVGYAYGVDKYDVNMNVLIFNLGGSTCNASILKIENGQIDVKFDDGDANFDELLVNHCVAKFERKYGRDLSANPCALFRLRSACEGAKHTLSTLTLASIEIDSLFDGIDFETSITRVDFEKLCADLFRNAIKAVKHALEDAEMEKSQVHEIVLVGGSTRIPKVGKLLSDFFSGKELYMNIIPEEAVAHGAALYAAILLENESERVSAKNNLESYCFNMMRLMDDEVKKKIIDKCSETLLWLDSNQAAVKDEFEHHQKELESVWNPIIPNQLVGLPSGFENGAGLINLMKRQSASNSPGEIEAKRTTMDVNIIDEVKQQFEQNKEDPQWAMIGLVIAKVEQLQQENLQQRKLIDKLLAISTIEGKSHKSSIYHFLPLETNLEILAFIDKRTVLRCLRPVCRWFRDVTARDYLRSLFRGRIKFSMIYSGIGSYKLWSSYTGSFDNRIMFNQIHGSDRIYSHYAYVFDATYEGRIYNMHVNTYKQDKYYDRPYSFFDEELTLRTFRSTVFRSSTSFLLGISKINLILKTSTCELYRFQTVNTVFYPLTGYGKNEAVYFDETDESLLLDWLLNEVSNEEASDPIFRRLHFQFRPQDRLVIANPIEFIRRAEQRFCALPENDLLPDMMELKFHFESNFKENTRKSTVNENCYCPAGFRTEKYNHNYTFVAFSYGWLWNNIDGHAH